MKGGDLKLLERKPRAHHDEEPDAEGSWAVSYGDMVTLLLTFFILFFSMERPNPNSSRLQLSLLNQLTGHQGGRLADAVGPAGDAESKEVSPVDSVKQPGKAAKTLKTTFPKEFSGKAYDVGEKVLVEFPGVSFFKSAKVEVTQEGAMHLAEFAKRFTPFAGTYYVGIRAFADSRKVRKGLHRYKDNLELSALRSISVMRELEKSGIPVERIRTGGFGELIVTAEELKMIPNHKRHARPEFDLARTVVLVIEPGGTK